MIWRQAQVSCDWRMRTKRGIDLMAARRESICEVNKVTFATTK
jgi:hypothetical protein